VEKHQVGESDQLSADAVNHKNHQQQLEESVYIMANEMKINFTPKWW
jgi:hypothetical protein